MNTTIKGLNAKEFLEVADYYKWNKFTKDELYSGLHRIYLRDDYPHGWNPDTSKMYADYKEITFEEWKKSASKENTMKYVVECASKLEMETVGKFLAKGSDYKYTNEFPWCINSQNGYLSNPGFYKKNAKEYGPVLSFKDWALMFGVELKPSKVLKLTGDYDAVVNYQESIVQVGCQNIPFSKVEELAKLIKE